MNLIPPASIRFQLSCSNSWHEIKRIETMSVAREIDQSFDPHLDFSLDFNIKIDSHNYFTYESSYEYLISNDKKSHTGIRGIIHMLHDWGDNDQLAASIHSLVIFGHLSRHDWTLLINAAFFGIEDQW